jgi:hypothetical protein
MTQDNMGTILSFRVSLKAKNELIKKTEQLSIEHSYHYSISQLIKMAIEHTWKIDCNDDGVEKIE